MLPLRERFRLARRTTFVAVGIAIVFASAGICPTQSVALSIVCDRTHEGERGLYHGKPFQDWIEALHARDVNVRREAAHALDRYDPHAHALVPAIFDTLKDPDPEVRRLGTRALGLLGNESDLPLLLEWLRDENAMVRATALEALGPLVASTGDGCNPRKRMSPVPQPVLSALIEGLGDGTNAVRLAAVESLQQIGADAGAATPRLRDVLRDASVGGPAFLALYDIVGPDEMLKSRTGDVLASALRVTKDQDPWSRRRAVVALGRFGKLCAQPVFPTECDDTNVKAALRALEGALTDTGLSVRFGAAESLGAFGAKAGETLVAWSEALKRDGDLAIPSAKALDEIGPTARQTVVSSLLESLRPSATHDDQLPKLKALQFLSPEGLRSGILIVAESLKQKDRTSQLIAASALGKMGKLAKPAIPALLVALQDPDPSVRFQASASLKEIGPGADAVAPLAIALRTGDADSRAMVAEVLGQMGPDASAAVPDLTGALGDPSERVRRAAGSALRRIGTETLSLVPSLARQLRDEDPEIRLRAVSAVATIGPMVSQGLMPELINALEDPDPRIRSGAIEAVREIARATEEALPALARRVKDEDRVVRVSAASALGEACWKTRSVVPALAEAAKDPEPSVRWTAIYGLENCGAGAAPVVPVLIEALKDKEKDHQQAVLRVLGRIGPEARLATVPLIGLLQDDDEEVRFLARGTLQRIGPDPELAVPAYVQWLGSPSRKERWIPAYALGKIEANAQQVTALGVALRDQDIRVRTAAISSLSGLVPKSSDSLRMLAEALTDSAPTVRLESVQALGELGPQAAGAVPDLIQALVGDAEAPIRRLAATALGNIGSQADTAIPALKKAAKDTDPLVRAEANRVLSILTAKP